MDTKEIESGIVQLNPDTPIERVAEVRNLIDRLKEACKEFDALWDQAIADRIEQTGKDVMIGTVRYWLGTKKQTKCVNAGGALNAALELAGGDMEAVCRDFLASQPFKHGAMRKAMEGNPVAKFDDLFHVEEVQELCDNGAAQAKKLQKMDTRFLR